MKRKKILAIFRKFNYYGAVNNSLDLILNLDQSEYDIQVIFVKRKSASENSSYINYLNLKGINYYFLDNILNLNYLIISKIPNFIKLFIIKYNWKKLKLEKSNFDIYYVNDHLSDYSFITNQLEINKTIYHSHYSKVLSDYLPKHIIQFYKKALLNIVNNKENKTELIKLGIVEEKIYNLNLAINPNNWIYNEKKYINSRKKNNIVNNQIVVAGSGDISDRKGADIFYEIYNLVKKNNLQNKFKFFWVGSTSKAGNKKNSSKILKNKMIQSGIKVFETTNYPYEIYNMIDIFIITSRKEVGPLTMLECMSLKKIVITHKDCGIAKEALSNNGGILVNQNKSDLYFDVLENFLENKFAYKEISENANKIVRDKFSFLKKADELKKIF